MRDDLSNEQLTNQSFLIKGEIELDGKLVETIMPFKETEPFETYLESLDEENDEGSIIVQEVDIFIQKDEKIVDKLRRSDYVKRSKNIDEKGVRYQGRN